ncbi:MAG: AF1514 family protein [Burkholderiales bacterium]|nr:AF1514 family protein [Burkholderiales bacterium]
MNTVCPISPLVQRQLGHIKVIDVSVPGVVLDYAAAHTLAEKAVGEAMLIAWFDGKNKVGYPDVQECTGDKPGWRAYAESHGGNLEVNINGGEFIFVFATGLENQGG